ncbi:hypothetical protein [Bacillus nakamurai]|uniref:hypothetical protein n=1 Tax=Bacillus nakamurai TaxID=1793963 RepID=UPI0020C1C8D8|nr:hypothetical protein [Bacillus nakamurai]MCP6680631.1 hypothetical protein [Bacillus nakamurai]
MYAYSPSDNYFIADKKGCSSFTTNRLLASVQKPLFSKMLKTNRRKGQFSLVSLPEQKKKQGQPADQRWADDGIGPMIENIGARLSAQYKNVSENMIHIIHQEYDSGFTPGKYCEGPAGNISVDGMNGLDKKHTCIF